MEKINRLIFSFLLAAIVWTTGCAGFVHHSDPLAGWHTASKNPNQAITDDYQNYVQKLSSKERDNVAYYEVFEDGTGQYAVKITIGLNHNNWRHVLIYDKSNKRIKTIKYISGNSAS